MFGSGKRNPWSFLTFCKVKDNVGLVTQGADEYANPGAVENLNENQIIWIFFFNFILKLLSRRDLPVRNSTKLQNLNKLRCYWGRGNGIICIGVFLGIGLGEENPALSEAGVEKLPDKNGFGFGRRKDLWEEMEIFHIHIKIGRIRALVAPNPIQPRTLPGLEQPQLLLSQLITG